MSDMWDVGGETLRSRFWLGTARYPSPAHLESAIVASQAEVITVSLRRQSAEEVSNNIFFKKIAALGCRMLPNTAGCRSVKEAQLIAELSREVFQTNWIKLEIIGDDETLAPNVLELVIAAEQLVKSGFVVFPYCTEDLSVCARLLDVGCSAIMPWAAPIGSGLGIQHADALLHLRARFPGASIIVDAGLGAPSDAAYAMELGMDGVLLNSAVALAQDPIKMAGAFAQAIESGRAAYHSGVMPERNMAQASTPLVDTVFWEK